MGDWHVEKRKACVKKVPEKWRKNRVL